MRKNENGFAAIYIALLLLFLLAATALAVDVSGFYETARTDQTTADLACLAGVPNLPENASLALTDAAENVQRNFPALASAVPSTVGGTLILNDGIGNTAVITTPVAGDPNKLQVTITETDQATFSRVIGATNVPITQAAYCKVFAGGGGDLPFGAAPNGAFDGILQQANPCPTGNCRAINVPRSDGNNFVFIKNVAIGVDRELVAYKQPIPPGVAVTCTSSTPQCSVTNQDPGVSTGQLSDGLVRGSNGAGVDGRLENITTAATWQSPQGRILDGDEADDILGTGIVTGTSNFLSQPSAWDADVHGSFPGTPNGASMLWYDGGIRNCNSPRLARLPIIAQLSWAPGQAVNLPTGNSSPIKIIGFYSIIIDDPDGDPSPSDDLANSDALKTASAVVVWYGPNAHCVGPNGSTTEYAPGEIKTYRLVDPNA